MIDDRAVEAAIAKFAEYGIEFASPRDGGLDDLELERYNALSDALSAAAPFLTQIPDGWKLVPVERLEAWRMYLRQFGIDVSDFDAMLAAAPLPPPTEKNDG